MNLLTPDQVAEQLQVSARTVTRLGLPVVRIGAGKGVLRFRQEDVDQYIRSRLVYEAQKENVDRVPKRPKAVGIQGLPSRAHLQALRMANEGRG